MPAGSAYPFLSLEARLRVLLLGATGSIGSAIAARLRADGHEVIGVARTLDTAARRVPVDRWIRLDLRSIRSPDDWLPCLDDVDAVVNSAGVFQEITREQWDARGPWSMVRVLHDDLLGVVSEPLICPPVEVMPE